MADEELARNLTGAYVYQITVEGTVRYVGKGRANRAYTHVATARRINQRRANGERVLTSRFYNGLAAALRKGSEVAISIHAAGLTDAEAYERERQEIAAAPASELWNQLPGGLGGDPEFFKRFWDEPGQRDRQSEKQRAVWDRPGYREHQVRLMRDLKRTPEARAQRSEEMKSRFDRPEYREAHVERTKDRWASDHDGMAERCTAGKRRVRDKFSRALKAKWADPEYREKMCAAQQSRWTPEARKAASERTKARQSDADYRERMAEKMRAKWSDPEYRAAALAARSKR